MAKNHFSSSNRRHLRQKITEIVHNVEEVMSNINSVLGEVHTVVNEIDNITKRLEGYYENKQKDGDIHLDANCNHCEQLGNPGITSHSKTTAPSPYMDYTYLELSNDCDTCHENDNRFTFNKKYPLWIQYDTWKAGNSTSEISEVSSGSDSNNITGVDSDDQSLKGVSNVGSHNEYVNKTKCHVMGNCKFEEEDIVKYTKCCNTSHRELSEKYCGVYEQIMEQQLDEVETVSFDFIETNQFSDTESSGCTSEDCSQDYMPRFTNADFWRYVTDSFDRKKPFGVVVRECSDTNTGTSE